MGLFIAEFPHLLREVDKKGTLELGTDINWLSSNSPDRIAWLCKYCGHHWITAVRNRTKRNKPTGCPGCAGNIFTKENSLAVNYPEIFREINIEKTVRIGIDPYTLTKSNPRKVFWNCDNGHDPWEARVSDRTRRIKPSGCPKCRSSVSKQEVRIYTEVKHFYPDALLHHKIESIEIDVFIPSLNLGVEFDGEHWHEDKVSKDKAKTLKLINLGIFIIRVREHSLPRIFNNDIFVDRGVFTPVEMRLLLLQIDAERFIYYNEFAATKIYQNVLNDLPFPIYEKSLAYTHPELTKAWNDKCNNGRMPDMFTYGSIEKIHWICSKGHKWVATINSRTSNKTGCLECYFLKGGSLAELKSYAVNWWDFNKNKDTPNDVSANTKQKRYFNCPKCKVGILKHLNSIHENWSCRSCSSKTTHKRRIKNKDFPNGLSISPNQVKTENQKLVAELSHSMPFYIFFDNEIAKKAGVDKTLVSKLKRKFTKRALEQMGKDKQIYR